MSSYMWSLLAKQMIKKDWKRPEFLLLFRTICSLIWSPKRSPKSWIWTPNLILLAQYQTKTFQKPPQVAPEACKQLQYRSQGLPRGSKRAPKRTKTAFKSLPWRWQCQASTQNSRLTFHDSQFKIHKSQFPAQSSFNSQLVMHNPVYHSLFTSHCLRFSVDGLPFQVMIAKHHLQLTNDFLLHNCPFAIHKSQIRHNNENTEKCSVSKIISVTAFPTSKLSIEDISPIFAHSEDSRSNCWHWLLSTKKNKLSPLHLFGMHCLQTHASLVQADS